MSRPTREAITQAIEYARDPEIRTGGGTLMTACLSDALVALADDLAAAVALLRRYAEKKGKIEFNLARDTASFLAQHPEAGK
jgi:hypothetical protein